MLHRLNDLGRQVVDLLFPPRCIVCQRTGDGWLCHKCVTAFPRVVPPLCSRCGIALATGDLCERCRTLPLEIDVIRSVFYFDGLLRDVIHRFKYDGLHVLAGPLAMEMGHCWVEWAVPTDVIMPVPLHSSRLRERGYNQAALLAREFARQTGLLLDEHTLVRQRATQPQFELDFQQRKENVRGAFVARRDGIVGKAILLIDDVCTTGATLEACATALYNAGAQSVCALTLARAR